MQAKEIRNLKWVPVTDWNSISGVGNLRIRVDYIESHVEIIFRKIAKELEIPYKKLEIILKEMNFDFYDRLYNYSESVPLQEFYEIKKLLRIPDISLT